MSRKIDVSDDNFLRGWEMAIRDAKAEIFRSKTRIRQLQGSIRVFEKKMKNGEPWPTPEGATHN